MFQPPIRPTEPDAKSEISGLLYLLSIAALSGSLTGIAGGLFHRLLESVHEAHAQMLLFWHSQADSLPLPGWLLAAAFGAACLALARWLVRFSPTAGGSGIQQVEAVMHGDAQPSPPSALPVKFIGGLLAMAPGSALGREGPTVHMASIIGNTCGHLARLSRKDRFLLYTAVAGTGLSVAFNAPLAGIAFVLEEVVRTVTLRRLLVCMTAISFGTMTLWATFGNIPAFQVTMAPPDDLATLLLLTLVGALMGALGAAYNRSIIFSMNTLDRFSMIPAEARAALIGIFVGLTGWFYLEALGGGEAQVQQLLNGNILMPFSALILFATRWVMGPMCYATGVPGGIFSPLLLIGALAGALLWQLITMASGIHLEMTSFVLIGMAAFFASVVRAPFTGILLITEMTASTAHMVPLLTGSIAAVVVATLLRNPPIYDELRNRTLTASKHV